jgi:hypothetical protein
LLLTRHKDEPKKEGKRETRAETEDTAWIAGSRDGSIPAEFSQAVKGIGIRDRRDEEQIFFGYPTYLVHLDAKEHQARSRKYTVLLRVTIHLNISISLWQLQ